MHSSSNQVFISLKSFDADGVAVVFGFSGGVGSAILSALTEANHFKTTVGFSRHSPIPIELTNEGSLAQAVEAASALGNIRLAIDATGFLHNQDRGPEKTWRDLDADRLAHAFAINAIGPALLMKHLLPRLPRSGKSVFATLSARVGSIGDNGLGGWYGYRASKAALNQIVRTASIELARRSPEAICVALHPGTVATGLSAPFAKPGPDVQAPDHAAKSLLAVINQLGVEDSGGFFDWRGKRVPW